MIAENLILNLEKIVLKLKKYGIKNVCLSVLVFITRVHLLALNHVKKWILDICKGQNILFINNYDIIRNAIYKNGLHLLRSGKSLLSNNFIGNISF